MAYVFEDAILLDGDPNASLSLGLDMEPSIFDGAVLYDPAGETPLGNRGLIPILFCKGTDPIAAGVPPSRLTPPI